MNKLLILLCTILGLTSCRTTELSLDGQQIIISDDLQHFWQAYDSIRTTTDSTKQLNFLADLFINKASVGQKRMIVERQYTPAGYLESINNRPLFWNSVRENTKHVKRYDQKLIAGVNRLKAIYPELDLATIYYTVGTHRSPGTGVDSLVMIGSEFALGDSTVNTTELPPHHQNYYKINPIDWLDFLTVHEYVHTQQTAMVHDLLSLTLYEGIAEFVAMKTTGSASPWKAFTYGSLNGEKIRSRFEEDMFKPNSVYGWLWNSPQNEFGTSDLAYYVGHQIATKYYDAATDKQKAIKALIELDYADEDEVKQLVNASKYFSSSLQQLQESFEAKRPTVTHIEQFSNGTLGVDSSLRLITLNFSEPMNIETRGFDFGPLGEEYVLRVENVVGFSEDGRSFSFNIALKPGKRYQSTVTDRFLSATGLPLIPYVIDFETK